MLNTFYFMRKFFSLIAGILIFDVLFYNHFPGLNLSIFSLLIMAMIWSDSQKRRTAKYKIWLLLSFAVACLSFAWYGDALSFIALFISFFVTAIYLQYRQLSFLTYPFLAVINFFSFPFRFFSFRKWLPVSATKAKWQNFIFLGIVPTALVLIFFSVYTTGSDLFLGFYQNLVFDLDVLQLLLLSCISFFILFNVKYLFVPRFIIAANQRLTDDFAEISRPCLFMHSFNLNYSLEKRGGEITLVLLNAMLLIFIIAYNYEQFFREQQATNLSNEIHQRIATVITSIVLAIGIILFYFRAEINFGPETRLLKKLSYIWIGLNGLLIFSALIKNQEYILHYGLTFKRISVFIFLVLCIIGLFFTTKKIKLKKTNVYLFNRMCVTFYLALIMLAPVNFSWIVTKYNLSNEHYTDINYLQSLPYNFGLLDKTFRNDPAWAPYFENEAFKIKSNGEIPILSSCLYDKFLFHYYK